MNLVERLRKSEAELKELIDRIAERQGAEPCAQVERAWLMRGLAGKLADMRSCIEASLGGLDSQARSLLEYRVRVELPLYSHLDSLSGMSREFVDWTAPDPSLGLTAIPSR